MVAAGNPFETFELWVEANVNGEIFRVKQIVVRAAYEDSAAREAIEQRLRVELMHKILEKWKPKIKVHSSSGSPW